MRFYPRVLGVFLITVFFAACGEEGPTGSFDHGVASGDPLQDAVIIWTRFSPDADDTGALPASIPVAWTMASDEALSDVVQEGVLETNADRDYTIKIDVTGLAPGSTYYYQFSVGDQASVVGRTITLPTGSVDRATMAVVSCSNYPHGLFNVYRHIAERDDIDVVLHLGDYIYEYPADGWGKQVAEQLGRVSVPAHEIVSLEDYRLRHAQYRTDPDLQAMTARHPLIAVWDDHESANDSSVDHAQEHDHETEGDWQTRKQVSAQAYAEWLPIRSPVPDNLLKIYRSFQFGDLANLIMLDTRLIGRAKSLNLFERGHVPLVSMLFDFSDPLNPVPVGEATPPAGAIEVDIKDVPIPFDMTGDTPEPIMDYPRIVELGRILEAAPNDLPDGILFLPDVERLQTEILSDPERRMLGAEQEAWLRDQLMASKASGVIWQVLGQQILMGNTPMADITARIDTSKPGSWSVNRVLQMQFGSANKLPSNLDSWDGYPVARRDLATDIMEHANNAVVLAGDTHNFYAFDLTLAEGAPPYAAEFGAGAVSSPGMESFFPVDGDFARQQVMAASREMRYMDPSHRGYLVLEVTPEASTASMMVIDTVMSPNSIETCDAAFRVNATDGPGVAPMAEVPCE
ncbi:MAG: alkaline phosphatase D family protein [Alphaproteobacteria bacterium]